MSHKPLHWIAGMMAASALALAACGDEEVAVERYPALAQASPKALTAASLGVGLRHGEALAMQSNAAERLGEVTERMEHAFLHVKAYDEFAPAFGEYLVYPAQGGAGRNGAFFASDSGRAAGRLAQRATDLADEVQSASPQGFEKTSFVVDFWRTRADWYVHWRGLLDTPINREGRGNYGFYRAEMSADLLNEIEDLAATHQPTYLIIGREMERLLATDPTGNGIAPSDFSNFLIFYGQAVERIKAVSPQTKVGAGFGWDNFALHVAPLFGREGMSEEEQLDAAFEAVILPFVQKSDVLALSSYTNQASTHGTSYQFLRRLEALYSVNKPVVWYSVGSPVTTVANYSQQRTYLENFLVWTAGVPSEVIAWSMLLNFQGSDTSDQVVAGRCAALTGAERGFNMPLAHCYDGLFSSTFQPKPLWNFLGQSVTP